MLDAGRNVLLSTNHGPAQTELDLTVDVLVIFSRDEVQRLLVLHRCLLILSLFVIAFTLHIVQHMLVLGSHEGLALSQLGDRFINLATIVEDLGQVDTHRCHEKLLVKQLKLIEVVLGLIIVCWLFHQAEYAERVKGAFLDFRIFVLIVHLLSKALIPVEPVIVRNTIALTLSELSFSLRKNDGGAMLLKLTNKYMHRAFVFHLAR